MTGSRDLATDPWRCAVCGARHDAPAACCRRCGADLLRFAKLRDRAARCRAAGDHARAYVLDGQGRDDPDS